MRVPLLLVALAGAEARADVDLHTAFDQKHLVDNDKRVNTKLVDAGEIALPEGRLAAFDAITSRERPFARKVAAGTYKVQLLALPKERRYALARVVFRKGKPVRWENAAREGEDLRALKPGETFGYGVDSGTGCFVAAAFARSLDTKPLADAFHPDPLAIARQPAAGPASLIAFTTGYGDGVYASWWGLDVRGNAIELVSDFQIGDFARPVVKVAPAKPTDR